MIIPHLLEATKVRINDQKFAGGKYYLPYLGRAMPQFRYKQASLAKEHAQRVKARWIRLYEAGLEAYLLAHPEATQVVQP